MIITKTPLRISFVGGGTDISTFYKHHDGAVMSTAIDKFVYVTVNKKFDDGIRVAYSITENVDDVSKIQHPIVRECMKMVGVTKGIEITTMADVPSKGTGLGSSSSFAVGLLNALHAFKGDILSSGELAEETCRIEIDILKEPIGKQDQYIAARGGFQFIQFLGNDTVLCDPALVDEIALRKLENNLLMFYTGKTRFASEILSEQGKNAEKNFQDLLRMKGLAIEMRNQLRKKNIENVGVLMHENWKIKKKLASGISSRYFDELYNKAVGAGAIGGKICFTPDSIITTVEDYKRIDNIVPNEIILDHRKNKQKVIQIHKREYFGDILEMTIRGCKDKINVTPDHPFMVTRKDFYAKRVNQKLPNIALFKEAKYLIKKKDKLLIPIDDSIKDITSIKILRTMPQSKYSNVDIYARIPQKICVDERLLYILGWYVAEGSSSKKQFNFAMHKKEIVYAKKLVEYIQEIFGIRCTIKFQRNGLYVVGSSVVISAFFKDLCGKGAINKAVPSFIINLPYKKQSIFLRELWHGDGCNRYHYDKRMGKSYAGCTYKTVSKQLAKQIQEICHRLGYITSYSWELPGMHSSTKTPPFTSNYIVHIIRIEGEDAKSFYQFIETGYITPIKRKNNKKLSLSKEIITIDNIRYIKRSISKISKKQYCGLVYNLFVENTHTYLVNDIAVHNCGGGGGGFMLFYCPVENQQRLRTALPLKELKFRFEPQGSRIIFVGQ